MHDAYFRTADVVFMKNPLGRTRAVTPQLPLFLLAKSGRPLVWNHEGSKAVLGYSNGPLALAAGRLLQMRGLGNVRPLRVSTSERLEAVVIQLARHGVRSMIWDHAEDVVPRLEFALERLLGIC